MLVRGRLIEINKFGGRGSKKFAHHWVRPYTRVYCERAVNDGLFGKRLRKENKPIRWRDSDVIFRNSVDFDF